jgi:hypothetical protein
MNEETPIGIDKFIEQEQQRLQDFKTFMQSNYPEMVAEEREDWEDQFMAYCESTGREMV